MKHYKGKFTIEQDTDWIPEQCPVTGHWSNTKQVSLKTWTAYEWVGKPEYQTPRKNLKNQKEAEAFLATV